MISVLSLSVGEVRAKGQGDQNVAGVESVGQILHRRLLHCCHLAASQAEPRVTTTSQSGFAASRLFHLDRQHSFFMANGPLIS